MPNPNSKEIVLSFIEAMNEENFEKARNYVNEEMKFEGVMASREGAEAYFKDMKKMKFKYEIKKAFMEREDVCLLYEIDMSGTKIFTCGWYQLKGDKINHIKVIFDPRTLFESSK